MKLHKLFIATLLAAGSLMMSSANAQQEKLFSAQTASRLTSDASLYGSVIPIGSQNETLGLLIYTKQSGSEPVVPPSDLDGDGYTDYFTYKRNHSLKLFSITGTEIKDFASAIFDPNDVSTSYSSGWVSLYPLGNGGFGLEQYWYSKSLKKNQHEYVFFSHTGSDWVETNRFKVDDSDNAAIQYIALFEDGMPPAGVFAAFRKEGDSVFADVYTTNKAALSPPQITSSLDKLTTKLNKPMRVYTATTNFAATGFVMFGLPPGLKFSAASGQISGKPTEKGTYNVVIGATKAGGGLILANKTLVVK